MDELRGSRRGPRRKILPLNKSNTKPTRNGIKGNAAPGGTTANDKHIEGTGRTRTNQGRLLDFSGRHHYRGISELPPNSLEAATVTRRGRSLSQWNRRQGSAGGRHHRGQGLQSWCRHGRSRSISLSLSLCFCFFEGLYGNEKHGNQRVQIIKQLGIEQWFSFI